MKNIINNTIALVMMVMLNSCHDTQNKSSDLSAESKNMAKEFTNSKQENKDACMMPIPPGDSTKYISKQVKIAGNVEHPLTLTVDSLKKMKVETIENFNVICSSGATMKTDKTCKGVLLKDILEKAIIKQANHKDRNFYIVARATDGYKATFSWAELFNNPTGENVYVLFEENGKPIKEEGDIILICKNDIKTGPRHVYWLKSIEVNRVE